MRTRPAFLAAALLGAVAFPASASAACVDTTLLGGVCQTVLTCTSGTPITVVVAGSGTTGVASCGGSTARCTVVEVTPCVGVATARFAGTMSCTATGGGDEGVAVCLTGVTAF